MVPRAVPTAVVATGLALVVAGVVMLTVAAPPQQVGGRAAGAALLVSDPGVLDLTGHPVTVSAVGTPEAGTTGGVFVGRAAEVEAWLAGATHTRLTGLTATGSPATRDVAGGTPPDPGPADIWQEEATGDAAALTLDEAGPAAVVVVSAPAADVVWDRPARHPGAWPLVAGGALIAFLGLLWLVALNARRSRARARAARAAGVRR